MEDHGNPGAQKERSFEVGEDEFFKNTAEQGASGHTENLRVILSNLKRTYDEYQQESLESIKSNRSYVQKVLSDAQSHTQRVNQIAEQALQNAVQVANRVANNSTTLDFKDGLQATRQGDVAADALWNPIQQGAADVLTSEATPAGAAAGVAGAGVAVDAEAVAAAVAKSVDASVIPLIAVISDLVKSLGQVTAKLGG